MSNPEIVPGDRGDEATQDVVVLLSAITLPSIEPFGTDNLLLADLPDYVPATMPEPQPQSRLGLARENYDSTVSALVALKRLEDRVSACKAALVARLMGAATVEAQSTSLDAWQAGIYESSAHSELALALQIPERTAATLAHHSAELVNNHQAAFQQLQAGTISIRHAWTIVDEVETLLETPGITAAQTAAFEQRLLRLAPGTTANSFAPKARRAREATHPETICTRTKAAQAQRAMTLGPGKDGMSWLTLHVPSIAAEGIWVKCTRTARTIKNRPKNGGDPDAPIENRTLTQLRVDVAAALLLGQQPLPGFTSDGATSSADWRGNGSGYAQGRVDGIAENTTQDYLDQLEALQSNKLIAEPPLPEATVLVTVPLLGMLDITKEPAELVGSSTCSGPVPLDIARKLMLKTGSFLRVLTDPVTGEPLGLHPEKYQLRDSDRAVLRALTGSCYFPCCPNPVMDTETDHLKSYGAGGQTILENLRPACKRHHALRHFKDDKDRHGIYRSILEPDRHNIRLRGWTPNLDNEGSVIWTSPSGAKHRAPGNDPHPPSYPTWLEKRLADPTDPPPSEPAPVPAPKSAPDSKSGSRATSDWSPGPNPVAGRHKAVAGKPQSFFEQLIVSYIKNHRC